MNVVIRVDASTHIGSGHAMRCLTLAEQLRKHGNHVVFVCRDFPGNLGGIIEKNRFTVLMLPNDPTAAVEYPEDHTRLSVYPWQLDANQTVNVLENLTTIDWLIVDHYCLDSRWETRLRTLAKRLLVIDDLADRVHDCDVLLDQNLYEDMDIRYDPLLPSTCTKLLGPQYALLREEFTVAGRRVRDGQVRRILVFFGGMDAGNETGKTLDAMTRIALPPGVTIDVVVSAGNPHRELIAAFCRDSAHMVYHCQIDNMARLMENADLSLGAGGSTTWERCYVGLPTICIVVAANQLASAKYLHRKNIVYFAGESAHVSSIDIAAVVERLLQNPGQLRQLSLNSLALFPNQNTGTHRVVNALSGAT